MRSFADLTDAGLKRFSDGSRGTLYFEADASGVATRMIRHFDRAIPASWSSTYAEIVVEADEWVAGSDAIGDLLRVGPPLEVGTDFFAREFWVFGSTTASYTSDDPPGAPPVELTELREAFGGLAPESGTQAAVLRDVLAPSVLEASHVTYFDESMRQFVVIEPQIQPVHIERWLAIGGGVRAG